jgi:glycosyltransferase involved in cell wall biosynthesis
MPHVVLWSSDPVGERMAGPGIRYHRLAAELARRFAVTLVAPGDGVAGAPYAFRPAGPRWGPSEQDVDVLVGHSPPIEVASALRARGARLVYDLYVPALVEAAAELADEPAGRLRYQEVLRATRVALRLGDAFICASERQRDLWLGSLAAVGRLSPAAYRADPGLRSLVEVVPFGLDVPDARAAPGSVTRAFPAVRPTDRILLWGGGVWNWLDPLTVIRAVGHLAGARPDVKLVFLGLRHPSGAVDEMRMAGRATALADELGLRGRSVFFNDGWVPYGERAAWFADAALGVSAHLDTAEARFAYRTRLLDHLAAGTPVVVTRGDVLADLVEQRGLGATVAPGDADGWVAALGRLLDDPAAAATARSAVEAARGELAWERAAVPLAELVDRLLARPVGSRSARVEIAGARVAQLRSSLALRGVRRTVRAVLRRPGEPGARPE